MLQDYAATAYSAVVVTQRQQQTWQMAAFTVGYIHSVCMQCMHLHEKDTYPPQKKTICLKIKKPNKTEHPVFIQKSDLYTADLGKGVKKKKTTSGGTHLSYPLPSSSSGYHLAESTS